MKSAADNASRRIRVLALCGYPAEAAATRFRVEQFVPLLKDRGIDITVSPFLNERQFRTLYSGGSLPSKALGLASSVAKRLLDAATVRRYDVLFVQREAMIMGPAFFERLYKRLAGSPIVLDLDDATYVHYVSPTYGRLGSFLKSFGKTNSLIRRADTVICGNHYIAEYVESKGSRSVVIPTVVDLDVFRPIEKESCSKPVIGWIGTHSTYPFVESILPVLSDLTTKHEFTVRLIGTGRRTIDASDVDVELVEWSRQREAEDFAGFDIGLYPIVTSSSADEEWIKGKSGFKAVQYMAVGVPFVMSPVGVCAEIGMHDSTHFNAATAEDWYNSLDKLLSDRERRRSMGSEGRKYAEANFDLETHASQLAEILKDAAR